jgi:hypothetical protein
MDFVISDQLNNPNSVDDFGGVYSSTRGWDD